ncbi:tripartite tricarboxylate transporter TctB family protein [Ancylobacter sp. A5.8]|uniref:tripartite tricarboxylate transporter TctB family protein n=1 Tax=Ancylobacter gelatini TaxID=2919920 RepID=UPI001F4E8644|nr:tripartite tricarboxylate transporter TctB family protein [Ancylobacter gelatini]MCJ8142888.1 tripartite tricarboxylate transporter TctB family protein [Ancylobacter gelatini]
MNKDSLSGLVLLALAGGYYWATGFIADSTLEDEVGAVGLPHALTLALVLLGLILLVRGLLAARAAAAHAATGPGAARVEDEERDARVPRALGFLAIGAAYVVLLPYLGYLVSVALLIGAVSLFEGAPRRWTVPLTAIGGALLYWAVFVKLLGVNQPAGLLFQGWLS